MPATDRFSVSPSFCLTWSNCLFSCISCCTSMSLHSGQREIFLIVHYVCGLLIFSYVYTHMHVRGLRSVSGAIHSLGPHLPWLLRLAWHPLSRLGWLTQMPQEFICLCLLPQRGITSVCLFHLGSGLDLRSSCLNDKAFVDWPISSASRRLCKAIWAHHFPVHSL